MPKHNPTKDYREQALDLAKNRLPGWAFAVLKNGDHKDKNSEIIPSTGPEGAPIAFVGATPSRIDAARKEPLVGPAGETFRKSYLEPLGLVVADVVKTNAVPISLDDRQPNAKELDEWKEWISKELDRLTPVVVVALGRTAKSALGDRADFVLPHPSTIRRFGNKGEVDRKLRQIAKAVIALQGVQVSIIKADEEKQIVYGVVLSSYGKTGADVDAHNDWMPPGEIEKTAHDWFGQSRKIGISHPGMPGHTTDVDAKPVESHIEEYPPGEYAKAMRNEPHRVIRRKFGSDVAHSGDWILGAKLGTKSWAAFKAGELNAFSPEGLGLKAPATAAVMPVVTFVDPESPAA